MKTDKPEDAKKPTNKNSFFVKSPKTPQQYKTIFTRTKNFLAEDSFNEIGDAYSLPSKPECFGCVGNQEELHNIQDPVFKTKLATIYEDENFEEEQSENLIQEIKEARKSAKLRKTPPVHYFNKLKKKNFLEYKKFLIKNHENCGTSRLNVKIDKIKGKIDHLNNVICHQSNKKVLSQLDSLRCSPVKIYSQYKLDEIMHGKYL